MTNYKIEKHIELNADSHKVWDLLTNPELIKQYLFGTETISEWVVGREIVFRGEFEGTKYLDKGLVKVFDIGREFKYSYWSGFSGLEDKPENYHLITYILKENDGKTILTLRQENIQSQQAQEHSDKSWDYVLARMKELSNTKII